MRLFAGKLFQWEKKCEENQKSKISIKKTQYRLFWLRFCTMLFIQRLTRKKYSPASNTFSVATQIHWKRFCCSRKSKDQHGWTSATIKWTKCSSRLGATWPSRVQRHRQLVWLLMSRLRRHHWSLQHCMFAPLFIQKRKPTKLLWSPVWSTIDFRWIKNHRIHHSQSTFAVSRGPAHKTGQLLVWMNRLQRLKV